MTICSGILLLLHAYEWTRSRHSDATTGCTYATFRCISLVTWTAGFIPENLTSSTTLLPMTNLMHKFLIHLLQSSTCTFFEQYLAHPQEVKLY